MPFQVAVRFARYAERLPECDLAVDDVNTAELLPVQPVVPDSKPGLENRFCAGNLPLQKITDNIRIQPACPDRKICRQSGQLKNGLFMDGDKIAYW